MSKEKSSYPVSKRGPEDHEVRDQIVVAATEHFSRYGYEKTTVSDLAKSIGFSKAYIYKFFESKQAIGEMICANCLREIEDEVNAAIQEAEYPAEKLRVLFKVIVEGAFVYFLKIVSSMKLQFLQPLRNGMLRLLMKIEFLKYYKILFKKVVKLVILKEKHQLMKQLRLFI